jgi:hypothetical protein
MNLNLNGNKSSKLIEVERDELIFSKTPSGKFILKADFKGGKPHTKGGENYIAKEGDIVFPGKKRKDVVEAYKNGDNEKLERIRLTLPKDVNKDKEAKAGADLTSIGTNLMKDALGAYPDLKPLTPYNGLTQQGPLKKMESFKSFNAFVDQLQPMKSKGLNTITPSKGNISTASTIIPPGYGTTSQGGFLSKLGGTSGMGSALSSAFQLAPTLYDLGKGLLEKPEVTTKRYYNPQTMQYVKDTSGMKEALMAKEQEKKQIRNLSAGNPSVYLSNVGAAENRYKNALSDINEREYQRENQINNLNTNLLNQAQMQNLGLSNQYDMLDLQNKGAKQNFTRKGLEGFSGYSLTNEQMKNQKNRDNMLLNTLETKDFKYDPITGTPLFKNSDKKQKGYRYILPKNKKY